MGSQPVNVQQPIWPPRRPSASTTPQEDLALAEFLCFTRSTKMILWRLRWTDVVTSSAVVPSRSVSTRCPQESICNQSLITASSRAQKNRG